MVFTRYYHQDVPVPAGTLITAPVSIPATLETNHLERIEIDVPDGHDRQTGIRIVSNGTVIVPFALNGWIVANNHYFAIPFDDNIGAGQLIIQAYNTDVFDHTFYVRFVMSNTALAAASSVSSAQVAGTVAPAADDAVAALAVTPDDLAAAAATVPAAVPLEASAAPDLGAGP